MGSPDRPNSFLARPDITPYTGEAAILAELTIVPRGNARRFTFALHPARRDTNAALISPTPKLFDALSNSVGAFAGLLHFPFRAGAAVCAASFARIATGCLLNAGRCHRVHCYISGPVLLLGLIFAGLVVSGAADASPRTFSNAVSGTLVVALLSFVPEIVWRRYV
jgi:hypothetical protein